MTSARVRKLARGPRDEICTLYARFVQNNQLIKQFVANHMVDINGDEAQGMSYLDSRISRGGVSMMGAVRMDEKYRRTPKGWLISETTARVYFMAPIAADWLAGTPK